MYQVMYRLPHVLNIDTSEEAQNTNEMDEDQEVSSIAICDTVSGDVVSSLRFQTTVLMPKIMIIIIIQFLKMIHLSPK